METKHTPGPWVVWTDHLEVMAGPVIENESGFISGGRGQICEVSELDFDEEECAANAALIAAAPDLLKYAEAEDHFRFRGINATSVLDYAKQDTRSLLWIAFKARGEDGVRGWLSAMRSAALAKARSESEAPNGA